MYLAKDSYYHYKLFLLLITLETKFTEYNYFLKIYKVFH